jgi:hypothetical protein
LPSEGRHVEADLAIGDDIQPALTLIPKVLGPHNIVSPAMLVTPVQYPNLTSTPASSAYEFNTPTIMVSPCTQNIVSEVDYS